MGTVPDTPQSRLGSVRTVKTAGLVLGAVLVGALTAISWIDRHVQSNDSASNDLWSWWLMVGWSAALFVVYCLGLAFLLRVLRRSDAGRTRLIDALSAANRDLELAQELGRTGTWTMLRGRGFRWTAQGARLLGLEPGETETDLARFGALVHPDDRAGALEQYRIALSTRAPFEYDFRVVTPSGETRWLSARGAVSEDRSRIAGTVVDITARHEAKARIDASERKFRYLFEKNPLPFWVYDAETLAFLEVNEAAVRQYGYSREEFLAMTILDIRPESQRGAVKEYAQRLSGPHPPLERRTWTHLRKDGSTLDVRVHASEIEFRGRRGFLILAEDISEQASQERELAYRATHDACTGLLNSRALADAIQARDNETWRLASIQLRGLELVEDSLGEQASTLLLQRMARRLERLGHLYGEVGHSRREEFVLAVRCPDEHWEAAWQELRDELARPIAGADSRQQLESWVGTAEFPGDHPDAMEALRQAALAGHLAKAEGRPLVAFEPSMAHQASNRLRMAARIHRALEQEEFLLHYQPIRDIAKGRTVGLEALIRWPQADGGFVPPCEFIGVCEDTGLIVPLGRWVLQQAGKAQRRLLDAGHDHVSIAINVSQVQFLNGDLAGDFDEVFRQFDLPRGALHVELTESILMTRPEQALAILRQLRERGICVSLDDFGTGFSSMAYLRHLPIDAMKIDRAFVHKVHEDTRNASICQALLSLGHSMDLIVVAEGVEEQAEYEWLKQNRCDQAQGYCLGRPAPLELLIGSF